MSDPVYARSKGLKVVSRGRATGKAKSNLFIRAWGLIRIVLRVLLSCEKEFMELATVLGELGGENRRLLAGWALKSRAQGARKIGNPSTDSC